MTRWNALTVSLLAAAVLPACGGSVGSGSRGQTAAVEVQPPTANVMVGGTVRYEAEVTGAIDTGVVWSVVEAEGGTITQDGLYTAPAGSTGTFTVRAASRAAPGVQGTATVAVNARAACGNGTCEAGETAASCPADCGTTAVCGNGACESPETAATCPADCTTPVAGAIIADHTAAARFSAIPKEWLDRAKALTLHYARASHGGQILSGMEVLEAADPVAYSFAVRKDVTAGLPPAESLPAMLIYDGNPPETYIYPNDYWDGEAAKKRTRDVANTGAYDLSMYAWCWQQEQNTGTQVANYLAAMDGFETEFPAMRFILQTGHANGTNTPTTPNTLKYNNRLVREHAKAHGKVLYDFEDIESYDPDGNYYPNTGTNGGECTWCASWCTAHPDDCEHLPRACPHSHGFNCIQKAKAFWWMMARLAGWPGN